MEKDPVGYTEMLKMLSCTVSYTSFQHYGSRLGA